MINQVHFKNYMDLNKQLLFLDQQGQFLQAYELAGEFLESFFMHSDHLIRFQLLMSAKLKNQTMTMRSLQSLWNSGFWIKEEILNSETFSFLEKNLHFQDYKRRFIDRCLFVEKSKPKIHTIIPEFGNDEFKPLLLTLHGNGCNLSKQYIHWRVAAQYGWIVGIPQSSQIFTFKNSENEIGYEWNDYDRTKSEIHSHFEDIQKKYNVNLNRIVLGGFSKGAETAIQLLVTGEVNANGFIAVCPGGKLTLDPISWKTIISKGKNRDFKGLIIIGEKDRFAEGGLRLADLLNNDGINTEVIKFQNIGHEHPKSFEKILYKNLSTY